MNNSEDLPNQPSAPQSLPSPQASILDTSNPPPQQPLLDISPSINFYQWVQILSVGLSVVLLLIIWSLLFGVGVSGSYISIAIVLTIIVILHFVHILSVVVRRITVTPEEIIDKQGFLGTKRIMRHSIADCRVVMSDIIDGTTKFTKSPIQEEVLLLVGWQGEIVGKIDVSAFAASDIEQLVSVLKINPLIAIR
jgi:hypothetical protein